MRMCSGEGNGGWAAVGGRPLLRCVLLGAQLLSSPETNYHFLLPGHPIVVADSCTMVAQLPGYAL